MTDTAWLDLGAGALVVISLLFLFRKNGWYWVFSNLSVFPYFALFIITRQYMLAGLQVSYLIFGLHGQYLWWLEQRRDRHGRQFNERVWYNLGWVLTALIFAYTVYISQLSDRWAWLQFAATSAALVANWATTRKWIWSWWLWIAVNAMQAALFTHLGLWYQVGLQFILAAMSVRGLILWKRDTATP